MKESGRKPDGKPTFWAEDGGGNQEGIPSSAGERFGLIGSYITARRYGAGPADEKAPTQAVGLITYATKVRLFAPPISTIHHLIISDR